MNNKDYKQLITDLCSTVGLASTQSVIDSQHLTIAGMTVGLIFDEKISPNRLFIYIDLGSLVEGREAELQRSMLTSNVRADGAATGHFGIHPTTGNAVYHIRLAFNAELTGVDLAQFLSYHATHLQGWAERCLAAPASNQLMLTPRMGANGRHALGRRLVTF